MLEGGKMKPLEIQKLPLNGTVCIEASAGTGKTFTIGLIVLRLVMERGLDLRRLAVVTFTDSATGELAERISGFLRIARDHAAGGVCTEKDRNIFDLVDSAKKMPGEQVLRRLDDALLNLDLARISTIHGFCSRILNEFAFETKSSFGMEVIKSQQELMGDILADFWRIEIATLDAKILRFLGKTTPGSLRKYLRDLLAFPGLAVDGPKIDLMVLKESSAEFEAEYDRIKTLWKDSRNQILEILTEDPHRFNQQSFHINSIPGYLEEMDQLFCEGKLDERMMVKFSFRNLESKIKKDVKYVVPSISFLTRIEPFVDRFKSLPDLIDASIKTRAHTYLVSQLKARQRSQRLRSYDSMISDLADALRAGGESTSALIRKGFSAVLVDEFQDTDPLQYEIFRRLFYMQDGIFFGIIGDPKQAIYRFRGGDIDTYIRARNGVPERDRHTIDNNYRSEPRLVHALNRIYEINNPAFGGRGPFLVNEIGYIKVNAKQTLLPPEQGGGVVPPITLWNAPDGEKTPEERLVGRRIADTIAGYMDSGRPLTIGPAGNRRPLKLGDIAILVNSHKTARLFKKILAQSGIRSVVGKSGSIFRSEEADDLMLLLEAIHNPSKEETVRALLVSSIHGFDLDALTGWERSDADRIATLDELNDGNRRWTKEGIAVALNHLLTRSLAFSLSNDPDRELFQERRITNFRHLIEILHTEELRVGRNPERLLSLFQRLRAEAEEAGDNEEMEQRLESDYDSVQIITMHKAKGLQWPVVFAPDLWRDGIHSPTPVAPIFSDERGRRADLNPEKFDEIKEKVHEEIRQERMRIAYVTLTRAESLLVAVTVNKVKPQEVKTQTPQKGKKPGPPKAKPVVADLSPSALLLRSPELITMKDEWGPLVRSEELTDIGVPRRFKERTAPTREGRILQWDAGRALSSKWSVGSYSGLTHGIAHGTSKAEPDSTTPEGIFAFPRGADAGTALHSVFERIDFVAAGDMGDPPPEVFTQLIEGILTDAGFPVKREPQWVGYVAGMVKQVMQAPIPIVSPGFRLADLYEKNRLAELEFHLTAAHPDQGKDPVTEKKLEGVLGPDVGRIVSGRQLAGFLNGFIDLVFRHNNKWWILDWKSNHLGNSAGRYDQAALESAMKEHNYHLQYHFYTVALTRYLSVASGGNFDYERDFGGILYLFIRGVDAHGNGIFHARPEREVISCLEEML
jgi:exodeoxyribonuclease V beta subunit